MKKLVAVLMLVSGVANASCVGPYCWDDKGASVPVSQDATHHISLTLTELNASTPARTGEVVMCSTCNDVLCVSTGTTRGGYSIITDSTTHCN